MLWIEIYAADSTINLWNNSGQGCKSYRGVCKARFPTFKVTNLWGLTPPHLSVILTGVWLSGLLRWISTDAFLATHAKARKL